MGWDPLGYLAWIPFATPEGSRKLFIDPMLYLPVPWGLLLLKILGYPRCLVLFKSVMWFVEKRSTICKEPNISFLSKWNRTTTGVGLVKLCFWQQYKLTNLNYLNYGDEVNNAIKLFISVSLYPYISTYWGAEAVEQISQGVQMKWTLLWPCPHWSVLSCRMWAGWAELQWWQQSPNCSNLIALLLKESEQLMYEYHIYVMSSITNMSTIFTGCRTMCGQQNKALYLSWRWLLETLCFGSLYLKLLHPM